MISVIAIKNIEIVGIIFNWLHRLVLSKFGTRGGTKLWTVLNGKFSKEQAVLGII